MKGKYAILIIASLLIGFVLLLKLTEDEFNTYHAETTEEINEIHESQNEVFDFADEVISDNKHKAEELIHLDSLVTEKDMTIEEYSKKLERQLYRSEQARKIAIEMENKANEMSEMAKQMEMKSKEAQKIAEHKYHSLRGDYEKVLMKLQDCEKDSIPLTIRTTVTDTVYINNKKRKQ